MGNISLKQEKNSKKELLTIIEVAEILGVHVETLRRWDNDGKLKAIRIGERGHRKYRLSDINEILKKNYGA